MTLHPPFIPSTTSFIPPSSLGGKDLHPPFTPPSSPLATHPLIPPQGVEAPLKRGFNPETRTPPSREDLPRDLPYGELGPDEQNKGCATQFSNLALNGSFDLQRPNSDRLRIGRSSLKESGTSNEIKHLMQFKLGLKSRLALKVSNWKPAAESEVCD